MKARVLLLTSLLAVLASPAFSQKILGYASLGPWQTRGDGQDEIFSTPNPSTNKIYVSDTTVPGVVIVVSGATRKVLTTIPVGPNGSEVVVNPTTNTIYALNGDQSIWVIDGSVDQVIAIIPPVVQDDCLVGMAVDTSANQLVVLDNCAKSGYVLDGSSYQLLSTVPVPAQYMTDSLVNPKNHLLYVVDDIDHEFVVADLTHGTSKTISVPGAYPQSVAIDGTLNRVYMADDVLGEVYVFNALNNALIASFQPFEGPGSVAVNENTHTLAVTAYKAIYFYHGASLAADGEAQFKESFNFFSVNSTTNQYYTGIFPENMLVFVSGPTK